MAELSFNEAYRTHEFVVEVDNITSPNVTKVSGLSDGDVDAIDQPDGGSNIIHKISSGIVKFDDITLERNLDGTAADQEFLDWFQEMFNINGNGAGSSLRRNGSIVKMHNGDEVMRWAFSEAWVKSSKFADLEAGSSNLMKQTIVLAVERVERIIS